MEYDSQHSIHTPFKLEYGWSFCKYTPSHNRNENQRITRSDGIMECFCMMYVFLRRRDWVFCLKNNTNYRVSSQFLPFGKAGVGLPGSGLPCPKAPNGSPWVGVALSESPEWVSPGRGCLVRKPRMGLLGSGVPCPKARSGSPRVGGALSEGSERASFVQNESPQTCGKGFCAPNES